MAWTIQLRRGMASEWTSANPVLADGEIGVERDTKFYKIGDGVTPWNALEYSILRTLDDIDVALMSEQATPTPPSGEELKFYAKSLAGRMMLRQLGPSGLSTPLQPSFFQNNIVMINTGATSVLGTIGNTVTSAGAISHPVPTEQYGYMANFVTTTAALATCGTGNLTPLWVRGSGPGANGFFYNARLAYPDSIYNTTGAGTGSRTFVGLTSGVMSTSVASDNPVGHLCGFFRRHTDGGAQDDNWQFATKDGAALALQDTGLPFIPEKVYDFYIFCPPAGNVISWRIDNVTDETGVEGQTSLNLPGAATYLRAGFQLQAVEPGNQRNIRMQRVYVESDR